jgi:hypothetical protein
MNLIVCYTSLGVRIDDSGRTTLYGGVAPNFFILFMWRELFLFTLTLRACR